MIGFAKAAAAAAIEEKSFNLDLLCSLNSLAPNPLRPPPLLALPPPKKQTARAAPGSPTFSKSPSGSPRLAGTCAFP